MSSEVTNMVTEERAEELRNATDRHIASTTLPAEWQVTTNVGISDDIRNYYQEPFSRELRLFDACLVDFSRLDTTEVAGCKYPITKHEIWNSG